MKSRPDVRPCNCGSGLSSAWTYDAKGVEIARVCDRCRDRVLDAYRREVLVDPGYELDEPLDDDPGFGGGLDDQEDGF
jgi:hypothetical protein